MRKNRREYDDDDGHVIAPMNVPGMPWHTERAVEDPKPSRKHDYSKKESFYIILGSLKAALLIAGAFIVVFGLFIGLICLLS